LRDLNFGLVGGFFVDIDLYFVDFLGGAHLLDGLFGRLAVELVLGLHGNLLFLLNYELAFLDVLDFFGEVLEHLLKLERLLVKRGYFVRF
jgi:hypothetical protein